MIAAFHRFVNLFKRRLNRWTSSEIARSRLSMPHTAGRRRIGLLRKGVRPVKLNRTSLLYSTLILTGVSAVAQAVGFIYRIFLSRLIGAEVMGLYQLILPVYSVMTALTASGLTVAVSTLSSEYHALHNHRAVSQLLRMALRLFVLLWAVIAAVVFFGSDAISVSILGDARTQLGLIFLLPCLLLTGVENLHKHHFYGVGEVRLPAAVELGEQFIRAGAVLGLLVLFLPQYPERVVGLIVLGMLCSEVFSSSTLTMLRRRRERARTVPEGSGEASGLLCWRLCKTAAPISTTALLNTLMSSLNAVLIPQRMVAAGMEVTEAISSFGVLFGMTMPLLMLPSAFISALCLAIVPKLTECCTVGNRRACQEKVGKALLATSVLTLPALTLLVPLGPTIGVSLFQDARAGEHILPLSIGVALSCYQSVLAAALNGVQRQNWAAAVSLLCGGLQLAFTWVGTGLPGVGLYGYILGFVVSSALSVLVELVMVARCMGLRLSLFQALTAPALSSLLTGLCVNLLFHALSSMGMAAAPAIVICLCFGLFLYLLALHVQGVEPLRLFHLK